MFFVLKHRNIFARSFTARIYKEHSVHFIYFLLLLITQYNPRIPLLIHTTTPHTELKFQFAIDISKVDFEKFGKDNQIKN